MPASTSQSAAQNITMDMAKDNGPYVSSDDFRPLEGRWDGTLQYIDYKTDALVSIATQGILTVKENDRIQYDVSYPQEAWENKVRLWRISDGGTVFDGQNVESYEKTPRGVIFTTQMVGTDDNRPANIRMTYALETDRLQITKYVRYQGDQDFQVRHIYDYRRAPD